MLDIEEVLFDNEFQTMGITVDDGGTAAYLIL